MEDTVIKPWGLYTVLKTTDLCQVKEIIINPGHRPSLQSHQHRKEDWIIITGEGLVTIEDNNTNVLAGSHIFVDFQEKHRIKNTGADPLVFIEVQTGTSFEEGDIVRYEDDYDRN